MNKPIVQASNLYKVYPGKCALDNLDLEIEKGKIVGLLGPNGSGKTTFMKLLNGLLTVTNGSLLVDGKPIDITTKSIVSYLPDQNYLNEWMNVDELINFFCDFYADFDREKAYRMLKSLNITPSDKLKSMSKGTKEKVQLILVMSRKAKLYLLDEPIGGVDPASRDYILNTIISNYSEDATIIISTHLIADIEQVLDEVIFIKDGKIVMKKSTDEIRAEHDMSVDQLFREEFKC